MKFLCPKCERLVELRDFKVDGTALVLTCPACAAASRVTAPSSPPVALVPLTPVASPLQLTSIPGTSNVVALRLAGSDAVKDAADSARGAPFEVPLGRCPKCIAPRQSAGLTCSQCGLTFSQFDAAQVAPPPWLKSAWVQLLSDWGTEERHAELRQRALAEQDLAAVGRLYRLRLISNPDDPFAQRGRDEVLRMALVPGVEPRPSVMTEKIDAKWKYVLVGAFFLICLFLLTLMARAMLSPE
jgi:hypothetical protein